MDCVIRVMKGPEEGQEFHCAGVETVIGRSPRSQVRLSSPSVSYEHAVITRSGTEFFLENLSAAGTWLRDERIAGKIRLRTRDQFRVGETTLRVEALPAGSEGSGKKRALVIGVSVLFIVLLIVVILDPFSPGTDTGNWKMAYAKIDDWTQRETASENLPAETVPILHDGWRFEMAGNRSDAARQWLRLSVLLDHEDAKMHFKDASAEYPRALNALLHPDPKAAPLNDDQMAAALLQFVTRMADRK